MSQNNYSEAHRVHGIGGMAGWPFISVRPRDDGMGTRTAGWEISLFAGAFCSSVIRLT